MVESCLVEILLKLDSVSYESSQGGQKCISRERMHWMTSHLTQALRGQPKPPSPKGSGPNCHLQSSPLTWSVVTPLGTTVPWGPPLTRSH